MESFTLTYILTVTLLIFADKISCSILSTALADYDRIIRPNYERDEPVIIECSLHVESFGNIEEADMEYKVYGYFHQNWNDPRLAGKFNRTITLTGSDIDNLWVPDPFCYNARESNLMIPNEEVHSKLHISTNGDIKMSKGITVLASCVMNLKDFPLDKQECQLKFGSYGYNSTDIIYHWQSGVTEVTVQHVKLAQFGYKGSKLTEALEPFSTETFSTVTASFYFDRRIGYFLIQVYFPDIFVVILSWIVFWMEIDDIGNRMALGITTILTIMFLLGSLNGNLPKVSYPKALDWYLLVSFIFVFLSLIEAIIVFIICQRAKSYREKAIKFEKHGSSLWTKISSSVKTCIFGKRTHRQVPDSSNANNDRSGIVSEDDIEMACTATRSNKFVVDDGDGIDDQNIVRSKQIMKKAEIIDTASRYLFPLTFALYNIYYWRGYYF
ncbi:glycine receptor subunit alphaZ1-like [Porites lutea]|uniref:glycine receptor subunit alphaZ1-like n=1 Tax=Porites lutea TaxID=51062 RepID=UPI003CC50E93